MDLGLLALEGVRVRVAVPELEVVRGDADLHLLRLAGLKRNALEAAQALRRVVTLEDGVQLDDFLAVAAARVLQVEAEDEVVAVAGGLQAGVLEAGVAQTVAEGEEMS